MEEIISPGTHVVKCRSIDVHNSVSAQRDLIAELEHATVVNAAHFIPAVRIIIDHLPEVGNINLAKNSLLQLY